MTIVTYFSDTRYFGYYSVIISALEESQPEINEPFWF